MMRSLMICTGHQIIFRLSNKIEMDGVLARVGVR